MSHLAWENGKLLSCMRTEKTPKIPKDPQRPPKTPKDLQRPPKIPKDGHPETSREALEMFSKLCLTNRSRSCNGLPLCFFFVNNFFYLWYIDLKFDSKLIGQPHQIMVDKFQLYVSEIEIGTFKGKKVSRQWLYLHSNDVANSTCVKIKETL